MRWIRKNPETALLAGCYAAGLLVLLGVLLAGLAANRAAYASGALAPAQLTLDDFELYDLVVADGRLVSTGGDPRMILKDKSLLVENVALDAAYSRDPLTVAVYWAAPGGEYSVRRMRYPAGGGSPAVFYLPAAGGASLRIDPGVVAGNEIALNGIDINQPRPFWRFFVPTAAQWLLLAVLPMLAACGGVALRRLWRAFFAKGRDGGPHD